MPVLIAPPGWSGQLQIEGKNYYADPSGTIDVPQDAVGRLLAMGFRFPGGGSDYSGTPILLAEDVPAGRAVTSAGLLADSSNASDAGRVVGIAAVGGPAGSTISVFPIGLVQLAGFSAGDLLWLGASGQLVASPPTVGFRQRLAVAVSGSFVAVSLAEPVVLI